MTTTHTPGPWKVEGLKVVGAGEYNGLIADVSAWWYASEAALANARLIALAPEMAEALRRVERITREIGGPTLPEALRRRGQALDDCAMDLRALLARLAP